ncbi:AcrR family transcriptional regulator [Caulobacter ginsengisoli]|uniref:AcrR family transcriptional regulator n=1 Tax=Caulobacter ginsengisoli TaxID=400775 RepID=A0ABU0IS69_9CAUL|nr:TetR family transcriptional regulator [Caulobacter ginsengisoli]MDQ0464857.1 AcrR family transcriptional regulator [Caulobacter ginsengisoli]
MLQPGPDALERMAREKRAARLDALLEGAAREFNARGLAGASLSRIARSVGLTRAALYYYVKDREALALLAYQRSCERMAQDLALAEAAEDGLGAVTAYLRAALAPDRPATAVLSELDALAEPGRTAVAGVHAANVERLRALIRRGIADGSIRPCDDEVIAQALVGAVSWAPLSEAWVEGDHTAFRARGADTLVDMVTLGQAADPSQAFVSPVAIEQFFPRPPNAFDREAMSGAKLEQVLMTASQLFNRRGVAGVSLDDIAAALGATKGAVYHYLDNKTELVVRCYERAFDLYERFAKAGEAGRNGLEQGLISLRLNVLAHASGLAPLIQMAGADALPAKARRDLQRRARALQVHFHGLARQGLADGSHRPMDFDTAAEIGAGVFEWLPKWLDPNDPRAAGAVADEICLLFIAGLKRRNSRVAS